jgi:LPXTG-motif cell wall-anchored protein
MSMSSRKKGNKTMRHLKKAAATLFCVAALGAVLSTGARADMWDRMTTVTFSGPVEIPGVHLKGYSVLPAGTYVFKLMDSTTNRHIVQIFTQGQKKCVATIMAIPNTKLKRADKTVITFRERPNGEPPALRAWFYPDARWGDEFVYGKKKAKELAQATQTPVLYNNSEPDETANAEVAEPLPTPQPAEVAQINQAEVKTYSPSGNEEALSQEVTPPTTQELAQNTPPPAPAPVASSTPAELPQTGSPLGWIMLSGLLSLAGGLGVKMLRQPSR